MPSTNLVSNSIGVWQVCAVQIEFVFHLQIRENYAHLFFFLKEQKNGQRQNRPRLCQSWPNQLRKFKQKLVSKSLQNIRFNIFTKTQYLHQHLHQLQTCPWHQYKHHDLAVAWPQALFQLFKFSIQIDIGRQEIEIDNRQEKTFATLNNNINTSNTIISVKH